MAAKRGTMKLTIRMVLSIIIIISLTSIILAKPNDKKPELSSEDGNDNSFFGDQLPSDPDKVNPIYIGLGIFCKRDDNMYVVDVNPEKVDSYVVLASDNVPKGSGFSKDISIEFFPTDSTGKIKEKYLAYEGVCQLMAALTLNMKDPFSHDFLIENGGADVIRGDGWCSGDVCPQPYSTNAIGSEWNAVINDLNENDFKKEIEWDAWDEQCLGQNIRESKLFENGDLLNSFYQNKQACCGDDYIWIMNKEINYEQNKQINYEQNKQNALTDIDNKCLYPKSPDAQLEGGYICTPTAANDHLTYDENVLIDGFKETHFSYKYGDRVTDVGLTFFGNTDPLYCHTWFDPGKGTQFAWMNWKDVVDNIANKPDKQNSNLQYRPPKYVEVESRNPHNNHPQTLDPYTDNICNLYLGGKFTGTYCCGAGKTSFNKNPLDQRSYNEPQETHEDKITGDHISNGACLSGNYVDYKTIYNPMSAFGESFIAVNGSVWVCNQPSSVLTGYNDYFNGDDDLIKEGNNKKSCDYIVMDDYVKVSLSEPDKTESRAVKTVTYCSPDKKWETFSFADEEIATVDGNKVEVYTSDKPGPLGFTNPEEGEEVTVKETSIKLKNNPNKELRVNKQAQGFKPSQCCFNGGCWNGQQCEPKGELFTADNNGIEEVYGCFESEWYGPLEPTYNWYNDTSRKNDFCFMEYSCTCPSEEYGEKEQCAPQDLIGGENSDKDKNTLCTNKAFYIQDDHLCEPVYEQSNIPYQEPDGPEYKSIKITDAFWTSRTKLLAFTLMQIAKDKDYTLFCDTFDMSLNQDPALFEKEAQDNVNSFCSLETTDGKVYLGVTLNNNKDAEDLKLDMQSILLEVPGLLPRTNYFSEEDLNNNIEACDAAMSIGTTDSFPYGEYGSCDNGKQDNIWFNNRTKTLIYSKDNFAPEQLTVDVVNTLNDVFKKTNNEAHAFINSSQVNKDKLKEKVDIEDNSIYTYTSDFNRLFIAKQKGLFKVFGVTERKADPAKITQDPKGKVVYYSYILYYNDLFPMNTPAEAESTCKLIHDASPDEDLYCIRGIGANAKTIILPKIDNKNPSQHWQDLTATLRVTLS